MFIRMFQCNNEITKESYFIAFKKIIIQQCFLIHYLQAALLGELLKTIWYIAETRAKGRGFEAGQCSKLKEQRILLQNKCIFQEPLWLYLLFAYPPPTDHKQNTCCQFPDTGDNIVKLHFIDDCVNKSKQFSNKWPTLKESKYCLFACDECE